MKEGLEFLENVEKDLKEEEAKILLNIYKGYRFLELNEKESLLDIIEATGKTIEGLIDLDTIIYKEYYRLQALYHLGKEDLEEYYRNGLQFLSYTKETELTQTEQ